MLDETSALQALLKLQSLGGDELNARIQDEIGMPLVGVFHTLAKSSLPEGTREQHARMVHLMVQAYLLRSEAGAPAQG